MDPVVDYRWICVNVCRKSAATVATMRFPLGSCAGERISANHHQQYLANNPDRYCGIGGCGVPLKPAELQVGEKAKRLVDLVSIRKPWG